MRRIVALLAIVVAVFVPLFAGYLQESAPVHRLSYPSGIRLHLTAEASQSLRASSSAFPAAEAGFSAYHRVATSGGGFSLDKTAVDQALLKQPSPASRRARAATLLQTGDNYTIATVPIVNIDGLTTAVGLYYDTQGWVVAYFPKGTASSTAWQAIGLDTENPDLRDVSATTLLDAINEVLSTVAGAAPLAPEQARYYHWQYTGATNFLTFATALGSVGSDSVIFAVPDGFTVYESSISMWVSKAGAGTACARASLDRVDLTGDRCIRGFTHLVIAPAGISRGTTHALTLEQFNENAGAAGLLGMLIYSTP